MDKAVSDYSYHTQGNTCVNWRHRWIPPTKDQITWMEKTYGHCTVFNNEKYWYCIVNSGPLTMINTNTEYLVHIVTTYDLQQWKYSYRIVCPGCDKICNEKKKESNGQMCTKQKDQNQILKTSKQREHFCYRIQTFKWQLNNVSLSKKFRNAQLSVIIHVIVIYQHECFIIDLYKNQLCQRCFCIHWYLS